MKKIIYTSIKDLIILFAILAGLSSFIINTSIFEYKLISTLIGVIIWILFVLVLFRLSKKIR